MAIYHLSANVISRGRGQSVVAAAAYRAGAVLRDERYGVTHRYGGKNAVTHSEILAPADAPSWVQDREVLWNRVEARERRKDSQLARLIEVGLPVELTGEESIALLRDYIAVEFVAKGMIADFCVRRDDGHNPHAHIMLTLRVLLPAGFGPKERRWNGKANLLEWRSAWAERANEHLARAGHASRIDHRTLEAQQIELTPGRNVGVGRVRPGAMELPDHLAERIIEQRRIAKDNGDAILEDPTLALRAITHQRPTFTKRDLAAFLRSRTDSAAQFDAAYLAVTQSSELVALAVGDDEARFTSRDMVEAARSLKLRVVAMAGRRGHGIATDRQESLLATFSLGIEQRRTFEYLMSEGDLKAVALGKDADKGVLLSCARLAWEAEGLRVIAAARSRSGAENLAAESGANARTLAKFEEIWQQGNHELHRDEVLIVDGSEMLDLKQLARTLAVADKGRAKLVLIADIVQLRAMKEESPFHSVWLAIGLPELTGL